MCLSLATVLLKLAIFLVDDIILKHTWSLKFQCGNQKYKTSDIPKSQLFMGCGDDFLDVVITFKGWLISNNGSYIMHRWLSLPMLSQVPSFTSTTSQLAYVVEEH